MLSSTSMKLLSLKQTSCRQTDVVFRASAIGTGVIAVCSLLLIGMDTYLLIVGHIGSFDLPIIPVALVVVFAHLCWWMASRSWRAAHRPTNWLLRIQGNDLLIKFRSYENWRLSEDDPQVILLHKDEIAFVRRASQKQLTRSMSPDARLCLKTLKAAERTSDLARSPDGDQQGCIDTKSWMTSGR